MSESIFEVESQVVAENVVSDEPKYGSKEWHNFVMSKFTEDELVDGNPKCAGLRRVAEELLGEIIESGPSQVFPATDTNGPGRATVVFEVIFNWHNSGSFKRFAEVADVWLGNTDEIFANHPVATASTRAEGRALRKALKVNCLAAEELQRKDLQAIKSVVVEAPVTGEIKDKDKITPAQINYLAKKGYETNVNVMAFVKFVLNKEVNNINDVTKKEASNVLDVLNSVQNNKIPRSEVWSGYIDSWRN